ncbi:hypothetical protein HDU96_003817 [Phlyctochytrium bullatum]|nr:hypothetical protein HDU96_003817 [Phlyctochytrium bullatum]
MRMSSSASASTSTSSQPLPSTTSSFRPTSTSISGDLFRQTTRNPPDDALALDSLWRIPAAPRSTTYPRSRFLGLNVRNDMYLADPGPCDPDTLDYLRASPPRSFSVSCGLPGLDEALLVCDRMADLCSGVLDRNATYSWRDVNQTTRFHVLATGYRRPKNSSLAVDSFYAIYYPTEVAFPLLNNWADVDFRSYRSKPPVVASGIYSGSAFRVPDLIYTYNPYADSAAEERMRVGMVVGFHVFGFMLLLVLYRWAVGEGSWTIWPAGRPAEDADVELQPVSYLAPGHADRQESELPIYSEAVAAPAPAKPEPAATPASAKQRAAPKEDVMYI